MAHGCFNFKDFCKETNEYPKIVLVFHALPKDENGAVDNDVLEDWLTEADIVFSLGKTIEDELISHISALEPEQRPIHKAYLPSYPLELFAVKQDSTEGKIKGTQNISMMSGEIKDLDINGLNFPLAVTATAGASQHIRDFDNARMRLSILVANAAEKTEWKKHFDEVMLMENMTDRDIISGRSSTSDGQNEGLHEKKQPISTSSEIRFASVWHRSIGRHCSWSPSPSLQRLWFGISSENNGVG